MEGEQLPQRIRKCVENDLSRIPKKKATAKPKAYIESASKENLPSINRREEPASQAKRKTPYQNAISRILVTSSSNGAPGPITPGMPILVDPAAVLVIGLPGPVATLFSGLQGGECALWYLSPLRFLYRFPHTSHPYGFSFSIPSVPG